MPSNLSPMHFTVLACAFLALLAGVCGAAQRPTAVWRDLTEQEIDDWYSPMEVCMLELEDREMMSPKAAQETCVRKGLRNPGHNKGCPVGKGSNKFPCYPPYKNRKSFSRGVEGYTNASATPVRDMLTVLAAKNMSLVLLGDSTMRQKLNALECEIMREDHRAWVEGSLKGILPCHSAHVINMGDLRVPLHGISIGPNSVGCLAGGLHKNDPDGEGLYENARTLINKFNAEGRGVYVLANLGLWYNEEAPFQAVLPRVFHWLATVAESTAGGTGGGGTGGEGGGTVKNIVQWHETMSQHWPNEIGSGYYYRPFGKEVMHNRTMQGVMHINETDWQVPGCCVSITNTTYGNDWRNSLALEELKRVQTGGRTNDPLDPTGNGRGRSISVLPFADITIPVADMHVCSPLYHYDCTHYCYWPLMWQPVWHGMNDQIKEIA